LKDREVSGIEVAVLASMGIHRRGQMSANSVVSCAVFFVSPR